MRIPIVDENDNLLYYRNEDKRDPRKEITRVSALWVIDENGNILLAQRAYSKKDSPGKWGPAVAGTVEEGETYESNIIKEAEEEIGLANIKPRLGPKIRRSGSHEYFSQWFILTIKKDMQLRIQKEEVETVRWFSPQELVKMYKENQSDFLPNFRVYLKEFLPNDFEG